jgi:hypothetical protein
VVRSGIRALVCLLAVVFYVNIQLNPSAITNTNWREYVIRFLFGGFVTALAGIIAKHFGPVVGGLFLAFPAIFPASATFIDKQQKREDHSERRAESAVAADAAGTAAGSVALAVFAVITWRVLPSSSSGFTLIAATVAWFGTAILGWKVVRQVWR